MLNQHTVIYCIWHVGTTQDVEDTVYSPRVKCGSQRNHWLFTAFSPGNKWTSVRPSHLRCRWTNDMELVPIQFAWAGHANWLVSSYTEDVSFWSVLGTLSALEALFATMRYINWHLHLHYICSSSAIMLAVHLARITIEHLQWLSDKYHPTGGDQ